MNRFLDRLDAGQLDGLQRPRQVAEQAMIDRVVLRAVRRHMTNAKRTTEELAQLVQLFSKQRHAVAVATAAIGQEQDGAVTETEDLRSC